MNNAEDQTNAKEANPVFRFRKGENVCTSEGVSLGEIMARSIQGGKFSYHVGIFDMTPEIQQFVELFGCEDETNAYDSHFLFENGIIKKVYKVPETEVQSAPILAKEEDINTQDQ